VLLLGGGSTIGLLAFCWARNLPSTSDEAKAVCSRCQLCAETKPRFHRREPASFVKATDAWERLSIDFRGPVKCPKPYLLVVTDEYSRFPFAFLCEKMTSSSEVVADRLNLFTVFGFPSYIHSDRLLSAVNSHLSCLCGALLRAIPHLITRPVTRWAQGGESPWKNVLDVI